MEVTGKLYEAFETKQVTERFTKREFVIEIEDGRYPQKVLFQLTGDRCSELDRHHKGEELRVEFSLRGREWTSPRGEVRYFNSLDVRRLEAVGEREPDYDEAEPEPQELPPDLGDIPF